MRLKLILTLWILFTGLHLTAQINPIFNRTDITYTKNFKYLVLPYISSNAQSHVHLTPQMITKKDTLKSFVAYQANVRYEPVKQFSPNEFIAHISEHIDTVRESALTKTHKNIFLVKTNGNGNVDNIIVWVTLTFVSGKWEFDSESFLTKTLFIVPGDIIFRPNRLR